MEQETCQHQSLLWLRWMDAIKHRNGESWNVPLVTWHVVNREGPYHRNPAGDGNGLEALARGLLSYDEGWLIAMNHIRMLKSNRAAAALGSRMMLLTTVGTKNTTTHWHPLTLYDSSIPYSSGNVVPCDIYLINPHKPCLFFIFIKRKLDSTDMDHLAVSGLKGIIGMRRGKVRLDHLHHRVDQDTLVLCDVIYLFKLPNSHADSRKPEAIIEHL